jgi:hypothetical protein
VSTRVAVPGPGATLQQWSLATDPYSRDIAVTENRIHVITEEGPHGDD